MSNYQSDYGDHGCSDRYTIVKTAIPNAPISVLDIGSNAGYFSRRIAAEYQSVVFSLEVDKAEMKEHIQQLRTNNINNNIVCDCQFSKILANDLYASPEVFDVTLLLAVVHWFDYPLNDWLQMISNIVANTKVCVIEFPSITETNLEFNAKVYRKFDMNYTKLLAAIIDRNKTASRFSMIGSTTKNGHIRPIFKIETNIDKPTNRFFQCKDVNEVHGHIYTIDNNIYHHISHHNGFVKIVKYTYSGITIQTLIQLNPIYPYRNYIADQIDKLDGPDLNTINIIMSTGGVLQAIDQVDNSDRPRKTWYDRQHTKNYIMGK